MTEVTIVDGLRPGSQVGPDLGEHAGALLRRHDEDLRVRPDQLDQRVRGQQLRVGELGPLGRGEQRRAELPSANLTGPEACHLAPPP
jgi:hypothetical protein